MPRGEEKVEASRRRDLPRHDSRWGWRAREWEPGTRAVEVGDGFMWRGGRGARVDGYPQCFAACGRQTALPALPVAHKLRRAALSLALGVIDSNRTKMKNQTEAGGTLLKHGENRSRM